MVTSDLESKTTKRLGLNDDGVQMKDERVFLLALFFFLRERHTEKRKGYINNNVRENFVIFYYLFTLFILI